MPDRSLPEEIVMPVTKPEAVAMAEIHAMRQVSDTLKALADTVTAQGKAQADHTAAATRAIERLSSKVDGMNERLIRLEEAKHGREIERLDKSINELSGKVDALEGVRDQQRGAKALVDWLRMITPWLLAGLAAFWAGLEKSGGAG
jgi:predicted RNase H-like nuclease (RuvC/YqgF family)